MTAAGSHETRPADRGVARRQAFLQAAREVFLREGYEAASVNDVVRHAGGSLATLYAQFGNKEGLFLAVTQDQHERFIAAMSLACSDQLTLEQGLEKVGAEFLRRLLEPENLAFFRLMVGEGRKFPQLLQRYIASGGADRVVDTVAQHIRRRAPEVANPDRMASFFLELLRSHHHYRALADETYQVSDQQIAEHVDQVVAFMMRGMGLRPARS